MPRAASARATRRSQAGWKASTYTEEGLGPRLERGLHGIGHGVHLGGGVGGFQGGKRGGRRAVGGRRGRQRDRRRPIAQSRRARIQRRAQAARGPGGGGTGTARRQDDALAALVGLGELADALAIGVALEDFRHGRRVGGHGDGVAGDQVRQVLGGAGVHLVVVHEHVGPRPHRPAPRGSRAGSARPSPTPPAPECRR